MYDNNGCGFCDSSQDCIFPDCYLDGLPHPCYTTHRSKEALHRKGTTMMLTYWLQDNKEIFDRLALQMSLRKHNAYWEQNPAEFLTDAEEALISLLLYTAGFTRAQVKNGSWYPQDELDAVQLVLSSLSLSGNA